MSFLTSLRGWSVENKSRLHPFEESTPAKSWHWFCQVPCYTDLHSTFPRSSLQSIKSSRKCFSTNREVGHLQKKRASHNIKQHHLYQPIPTLEVSPKMPKALENRRPSLLPSLALASGLSWIYMKILRSQGKCHRNMMLNQWFEDPFVENPFHYWWTSTPRYSRLVVGLPTLRSHLCFCDLEGCDEHVQLFQQLQYKHERKNGHMDILLGDRNKFMSLFYHCQGWMNFGLPVLS